MNNEWIRAAVKKINEDANRSSDTHLIKVYLPATDDLHLYLKDESTHVTGSLKHRLARSLYLYALCNGWIEEDTPVIEASSGSTAISEAYYARLLGLRYISVMAETTSPSKIERIKHYGGECVLVDDPSQDRDHARQLALELNGHFMDQFVYAELATDWRGNNNIAESIYEQMSEEPYPVPSWLVCGAGTGGTSATLGRYARYFGHNTQVCVVDPINSVFYDYFHSRDKSLTVTGGSDVEGIGRPQVEPSFIPTVVDHMIRMSPTASYAAMHFLEEIIGKKYGGSTGTSLCGSFKLMADMLQRGESGSLVAIIGDSGDLYLDTYYNQSWLADNGHDIQPILERLRNFYFKAVWEEVS